MTITDASPLTDIDAAVDELLADFPPASTDPVVFLGAQFDRGLAWAHFPEGCGGLGLSPAVTQRIMKRLSAARAPFTTVKNVIGSGMIAPTIAVHGTDAQKARYLRPLFTGEEIWCQLFSEPSAGSDVATLATKAVRDGDEWIITGQKVWTTLAHLSDFGLIIARTDPDQPKHRGITAFLVDMHAPGVEVRPLYQITAEAEFNECFFTEVRVPDTMRLGGIGEGWHVSITTLMNERVSIGGGVPPRGAGPIAAVVSTFQNRWGGDNSNEALVYRDKVMKMWVRSEVSRLTNWRASDARKKGTPGPEGSVAKLAFAEFNKQCYELADDLLGLEGTMLPGGYQKVRPEATAIGTANIQKAFLRVRANSIEGGTSEVMRNILGERVLGLPGEPRNDKDIAWKDVPKS